MNPEKMISAGSGGVRARFFVMRRSETAMRYGAAEADREMFYAGAEMFSGECDPSDVIEGLLEEHGAVCVPHLPAGLTLKRPVRLKSGIHLKVDEKTVVRMAEGCGGCMVRNWHIVSGMEGPVEAGQRDMDIIIEGGQWEEAPRSASVNDPDEVIRMFGKTNILLGVAFFCHAERVTVRNMVIRSSDQYGVLLADCEDFLVEGIVFDRHRKDGVHVNGPAKRGLIQNMRGKCGDDFVALNAWDWDTSAVSFGPIEEIIVQHIECGHDEMRILPGRKSFRSGVKIDCPVERCRFEDISGVYNFKMYQQPNCHNLKREFKDFSEIAGQIRDVFFSKIRLDCLEAEGLAEVHLDALFEMGADCEGIVFEEIELGFSEEAFREKGMSLAIIGPKSSTWTRGYTDPAEWTELFDPDMICAAEGTVFRNVRFAGEACRNVETLLRETHLTVNEDYPNTIPRGGTGYGVIRGIRIEE